MRAIRVAVVALALGVAASCQAQPQPRPAQGPQPVSARSEPAGFPAGLGVGVLGAVTVTADHPFFGGLSGLEVSADGAQFTALSDRGALFTGRLRREGGALVAIEDVSVMALRDPSGRPRPFGEDDPEALALTEDGALHVAFEGDAPRIWRYPSAGSAAQLVPPAPGFAALQINSGLEALAVAPDGALLAIPERSGALDRPFPVFRRDPASSAWTTGAWPRLPPHLVTGADVGPDGMLYVIERDFTLLGGFAVRVRRADLADWPALNPVTVFDSRGLDNLEGIALWRDGAGRLRMLLVSDDNFSPLQRTLFLELAVD